MAKIVMDRNEYIVEVKVTREELSAINRLLGFAYSPKALGGSIKPTTTVKTLIRAVKDKNLNIEYYG